MDVDAIRRELTSVVARHGATLREIGARQFQVLEIGALVLVVEHYRKQGYIAHPQNLRPMATSTSSKSHRATHAATPGTHSRGMARRRSRSS
jgi:hypothetical protein